MIIADTVLLKNFLALEKYRACVSSEKASSISARGFFKTVFMDYSPLL